MLDPFQVVILEHAADVHSETFLADVMSEFLRVLTDDNLKNKASPSIFGIATDRVDRGDDHWNVRMRLGQDDEETRLELTRIGDRAVADFERALQDTFRFQQEQHTHRTREVVLQARNVSERHGGLRASR